jgi:hypothetical protein
MSFSMKPSRSASLFSRAILRRFGARRRGRFEACPIHQFVSQGRELAELLEAVLDVGVDLGFQLTKLGDEFAAIEIFDGLVVKNRLL